MAALSLSIPTVLVSGSDRLGAVEAGDLATIVGTITDSDGNPVAGVDVYRFPAGGGGASETVTDELGRYRFDDVEPVSEMQVFVQPEPGRFLVSEPPGFFGDEPVAFAVGPGTTVTHDVVLARGGRLDLSGDLRGTPIGLLFVEVCPFEGGNCVGLFWDDDMVFPPGSYLLSNIEFEYRHEPPYSEARLPAAIDELVVEFVAGQSTVVVLPVRAARVRGRITAPSGIPIADAYVRCICQNTGAYSDADGNYEVWLPPGEQVLIVTPPPAYAAPPFAYLVVSDGEDVTENFELLRKTSWVLLRFPHAGTLTVDACEVGGPHCVLGTTGNGTMILVPNLYFGSRYDLFVSALVDGELRTGVLTDVQPGSSLDAWPAPDADDDGAPNTYESGDRDANGVADRTEARVVSARSFDLTPFSFSRVGFVPQRQSGSDWMVASRRREFAPDPPAGVDFPHGVMTARMQSVDTQTTLEIVLPEPADVLYLQRDDAWEPVGGPALPLGTVEGSLASVPISDGGPFDLDETVDGRVHVNLASASVRPAPFYQALIVDGPVGFVDGTDADFVVSAPVGAELLCSLDLTPFEACDATPSYADLEPGFHVLVVQPITGGDPGSAARADLRLWYAGAPPGLRAVGGPSGVTSETSATFTMVGPNSDQTVCLFDFRLWFFCGSEFSRSSLRNGAHFVAVFDPESPVGLSDLRVWVVKDY